MFLDSGAGVSIWESWKSLRRRINDYEKELKPSTTYGMRSIYLANCLETQIPQAAAIPNAAYGVTKAAQHYLTAKLHPEEPWLTSFIIDPG